MTITRSHRPIHWRGKTLIAFFVATAVLAGGERALAPTPASALIVEDTCENWVECTEGTEEGSSPTDGNDPFGGWQTDQGSGDQSSGDQGSGDQGSGGGDPFEGWQTDQGSGDQSPSGGDPFEGWETDTDATPYQPYRGYLADGTYYEGELTEADLIAAGLLALSKPNQPYRGFLDDGTYYEGELTEADLIAVGLLALPGQKPQHNSNRTQGGTHSRARSKGNWWKAGKRMGAATLHR